MSCLIATNHAGRDLEQGAFPCGCVHCLDECDCGHTKAAAPAQPPDYVIEAARKAAMQSPCAKSKRGAAAMIVRNGGVEIRPIIGSLGWNGQPNGFTCSGSDACRRDCARLCMHAEQRAVMNALGSWSWRVFDIEIVHVKVVDGQVVPGKGPCCEQCSRLVLDVGMRGVWLYEHDGRVSGAPGLWRFYRAAEFHRETLRACAIGDVA